MTTGDGAHVLLLYAGRVRAGGDMERGLAWRRHCDFAIVSGVVVHDDVVEERWTGSA